MHISIRLFSCHLWWLSVKTVFKELPREYCLHLERMVHHACGEQSLISTGANTFIGKQKNFNYQDAIYELNKLQSNNDVLSRAKKFPEESALRNVPDTVKYLARVGVSVKDLDKLKAIHVSGTKGKGSTCAFCESILRHHGLRTGFFSSPHMIAVRERIRINGHPLSEAVFAKYFWDVYDCLYKQRVDANDMPPYFKFLTIMAFYVFLKEKVDVAIVEVGIGGQYDCTNVLRNPVVCGISSLGLDHTLILGSTLERIAWQKAGIMKIGISAFTVKQNDEAMAVLANRAVSIGAKLLTVQPLQNHDWKGKNIILGLSGEVQETNAALAVQLTSHWLQEYGIFLSTRCSKQCEDVISDGPIVEVTDNIATGLRNCQWAGRYQTLRRDNIVFYLDGAHTSDSIKSCVRWFNSSFQVERGIKNVYRGLIFSITGDRTPESLLAPLLDGKFDFVLFSPTILFELNYLLAPADLINVSLSKEQSCHRCVAAEKVWYKLAANNHLNEDRLDNDSSLVDAWKYKNNHRGQQWTKIFPSINKAVSFLKTKQFLEELKINSRLTHHVNENDIEVHLLVTGSLHLVGGVLGILDPNLNCET